MTEFKTLNDMKEDLRYSGGTGLFTDSAFIDSFKLRQEAIKWVKFNIKVFGFKTHDPIMVFWMQRFNLTEADLK
jgi:hypothetical protein